MTQCMMGIETEYAITAFSPNNAADPRTTRADLINNVIERVADRVPHIKEVPHQYSGMFLQNGARFYIDCGNHPEMTTPECTDPWECVRYVLAGEKILENAAAQQVAARPGLGEVCFFKCNVDYSGTGTTWGCHESYLHKIVPSMVAPQIIPHLISRLIYTGAGGFDSLSPGIEFMISPRVAHLGSEVSDGSQGPRGIFHTKDEPLSSKPYHRLHLLCGESLSSQTAMWLKMATTALVVALIDAGLRPGDDVALKDPVKAMNAFARDVTCQAVAKGRTHGSLTALQIQKHYLEQVEAQLGQDFMPIWAEDVCIRWRGMLHTMETQPESLNTRLDWAIKHALYSETIRDHDLTWDMIEKLNTIVKEPLARGLKAALAGSDNPEIEVTPTGIAVKGTVSEVSSAMLRPLLEKVGLTWAQLTEYFNLRKKLFEIDTRFGQLGERGIFHALDHAGVLDHHIPGIDNIDQAIDTPPREGRARLRGESIKQLFGHGTTACKCSWTQIVDMEKKLMIDLSDPFAESAEWEPYTPEPDRRDRLRGPSRSGAIDLNRRALIHRDSGEFSEAETLFRRAIAMEREVYEANHPKLAHRMNNLTSVLLLQDNIIEADTFGHEAWAIKQDAHDITSPRILYQRVIRSFLMGYSAALYLGQLKILLTGPPLGDNADVVARWDYQKPLEFLAPKISEEQSALLRELLATLNDPSKIDELDRFPMWQTQRPVSLEQAWPTEHAQENANR